ncbi:MAG TPA: shikimate dehydrogenase [Polyangiaceae bacterium]|nr:shikimate dehydrogenase [Polyangiaceae bacterium]
MTQAKQFVLIGHPVGHSISPAIHRAAYGALGLSHAYDAVDCATDEDVRRQVERLRSGEIAGANVTVPHKLLALSLADRVDESARVVQAANVLLRDAQGLVVAHNTDALALADELGTPASDRAGLVIGNGGAALAAVMACRYAGLKEVGLTARRFTSDSPSAQWPMAKELSAMGVTLLPWPNQATRAQQAFTQWAARAAVVIQATSSGMKGADSGDAVAQLIPWNHLAQGALLYDLVYNPAITPFLRSAAEHQLRWKNGLGMLVGQAARAFSLWLGVEAPIQIMREAAEKALQPRGAA